MRDTIHRMGRRCRNWDYCGTGCYSITLVLNDRSRPVLGTLMGPRSCSGIDAGERQGPHVALSELGHRIEEHFRKISHFTPEIDVLGVQVMPEHLHGVLRVVRHMGKPLGEQLRDLRVELPLPGIDAGAQAHFAAIGNLDLLKMPHLPQVQCSRDFFAYRRTPKGDLVKEEPYATMWQIV